MMLTLTAILYALASCLPRRVPLNLISLSKFDTYNSMTERPAFEIVGFQACKKHTPTSIFGHN